MAHRSSICEGCGVVTWLGRLCDTCEKRERYASHWPATLESRPTMSDDAIPVKVTTFWQRTDGRAQLLVIADEPVERGEYVLVKCDEGERAGDDV